MLTKDDIFKIEENALKLNTDKINASIMDDAIRQKFYDIVKIDSVLTYDEVFLLADNILIMVNKDIIGKGAFGTVFGGEMYKLSDSTRIDIAIKKVKPNSDIKEEICVLKQLNCDENLLCYYEYFEHKGNGYIITRFVKDQKDLSNFINELHKTGVTNENIKSVIRVMINIASVLQIIHNKNIVHRDIKPPNILINMDTKMITLIDFGISCQTCDSDSCKNICVNCKDIDSQSGTMYYMAPEIMKGACFDIINYKSTDIYSLGIVFYELLTGHPPLFNKNFQLIQIMFQVCSRKDKLVCSNTNINNTILTELTNMINDMTKPDDEVDGLCIIPNRLNISEVIERLNYINSIQNAGKRYKFKKYEK
ncbi:MAG: protein kinase domain protein [Terrestrivirus sp.]|uniref:Protein kinase domain protein n=1 Tax=Terrestrivirus sp. TaxID=2487775 RepID=A0A3G4ZNQ8_9VIRU|nr:MAG: protein kinase domain protein [Terrestrivirus sp.]